MKDFFDGIGNLIVRMNDVTFTTVCKIVFGLSATTLVILAAAGVREEAMIATGLVAIVSVLTAGVANSD